MNELVVISGKGGTGKTSVVASFAVLAENAVYKLLLGRSGQQLGAEWAKLEGRLATPDFQFGIIAGGKQDAQGFNPLLPGDDDGTVTVGSTQLGGARDLIVVPVLHSFIMDDPRVLQCTLRFLEQGHFVSAEKRQLVLGKVE